VYRAVKKSILAKPCGDKEEDRGPYREGVSSTYTRG